MTEAQIEAAFMNPLQRRVFEMFVGMGDERSLPKLLNLCKASGVEVSEPTLKRWSSKFKWIDLAQDTGKAIADKIAEGMLPDHIARVKLDLEVINKLKDQFRKDVEAGLVAVTLSDYISLIKTEQLLTGNPTDRSANDSTHTLKIHIDDSEIAAVLGLSERRKRGLPSPELINVTPEGGRDAL